MKLAHWAGPSWAGPSASSSSSVAPIWAAPQRSGVANASERLCGVACNLWVARDRAAQQNAAVDGAVLITQEEATH